MFSWLWSWLFGRTTQADVGDLLTYTPRQRLIYSHFAGVTPDGTTVMAKKDPMELWSRLTKHTPELGINLRVAQSPSKGAAECHRKLMAQCRDIFEVKTFPEGGLTDLELSQLLDHFLCFIAELKKKGQPPTTASEEPSPVSPPSPAESPPTPSTPPSCSTRTEASTDSPTPSPSAADSLTGPSDQGSTSTEASPTASKQPGA